MFIFCDDAQVDVGVVEPSALCGLHSPENLSVQVASDL
jgi:hypothetical protein